MSVLANTVSDPSPQRGDAISDTSPSGGEVKGGGHTAEETKAATVGRRFGIYSHPLIAACLKVYQFRLA